MAKIVMFSILNVILSWCVVKMSNNLLGSLTMFQQLIIFLLSYCCCIMGDISMELSDDK